MCFHIFIGSLTSLTLVLSTGRAQSILRNNTHPSYRLVHPEASCTRPPDYRAALRRLTSPSTSSDFDSFSFFSCSFKGPQITSHATTLCCTILIKWTLLTSEYLCIDRTVGHVAIPLMHFPFFRVYVFRKRASVGGTKQLLITPLLHICPQILLGVGSVNSDEHPDMTCDCMLLYVSGKLFLPATTLCLSCFGLCR